MLKHGILGLLSYGDATGYEIMEVFRDSLNFFWNAQTSQIYRDLNSLEAKGLATSQVVPQDGRPDRRVYSITDAGRAELNSWLARPFPTQARLPILMQVFFMGALPPEMAKQRFAELEAFARHFSDGLEAADAAVEHYRPSATCASDPLFWDMTIDFGRRYTRMIAEWSEACQQKMAKGIPPLLTK